MKRTRFCVLKMRTFSKGTVANSFATFFDQNVF